MSNLSQIQSLFGNFEINSVQNDRKSEDQKSFESNVPLIKKPVNRFKLYIE